MNVYCDLITPAELMVKKNPEPELSKGDSQTENLGFPHLRKHQTQGTFKEFPIPIS